MAAVAAVGVVGAVAGIVVVVVIIAMGMGRRVAMGEVVDDDEGAYPNEESCSVLDGNVTPVGSAAKSDAKSGRTTGASDFESDILGRK